MMSEDGNRLRPAWMYEMRPEEEAGAFAEPDRPVDGGGRMVGTIKASPRRANARTHGTEGVTSMQAKNIGEVTTEPRLFGHFAARCLAFAKELRKVGHVGKDIYETFGGGRSWEVIDMDEEGRYTGMIYRVSVERSRYVREMAGKKPWEV